MRFLSKKYKDLYRKFFVGCLCLAGIPLMILVISIKKGAGWAGLVPGIPVYVTLAGAAIYQFIKEFRALRQEEGDPPPDGEH